MTITRRDTLALLQGAVVGGGLELASCAHVRVTEMMLIGRVYDADEALQIGLAHYTVADGTGLAKARELATRIAGNAPMSNYAILQALPLIAEQPIGHGLMTESLMAALTQSEPEAKARVEDFLAKRAAKVMPR